MVLVVLTPLDNVRNGRGTNVVVIYLPHLETQILGQQELERQAIQLIEHRQLEQFSRLLQVGMGTWVMWKQLMRMDQSW